MPHTFRTTLAGAFTLISTAAIAQEGPLVTTDWLEANLQNPAVRLSEVSVNPGVFERGPYSRGHQFCPAHRPGRSGAP